MTDADDQRRAEQIGRLSHWRHRRHRTSDLSFVQAMFDKQIARPHKQVGQLAELWNQFVPTELVERTRLDRYSRQVLHVTVADSATSYRLDRALRAGLLAQIRREFAGNLRSIKLTTGPIA